MKLLTRTDLHDLALEVENAVDRELDKLMDIEDVERRALKAEHGLFGRLTAAGEWLRMMQRCVKTDDAVIALEDSVSVTLYDAHIELPQ